MPMLTPTNTDFAKIKVIGVGGGGCNAIDSMIKENQIKNVEFIAINTDNQALMRSKAQTKVLIGKQFTKGLGSGGDPEVGKQAAVESRQELHDLFYDTDMVFITAGMGGGTGTGATPIIAEEAKKQGALTVAVVTKPFDFEGKHRMQQAHEGLQELIEHVDAHIVVPNQNLITVLDKDITLANAFLCSDEVLGQGVRGITDLITIPGQINADFADVRNIMMDSGTLLMGNGEAEGPDRAKVAAQKAIHSPLLELSVEGAKGLIFNITAGSDVKLSEITEAAAIITACAESDAAIKYGHTVDESMGGKMKITVIATDFREKVRPMRFMKKEKVEKNDMVKKDEQAETAFEDQFSEYEIPAFLRE